MNIAFILKDLRALPLMYQLGYKNSKPEGAGLAEEALQVAQRHPDWVEIIGSTDMDADQLTGEIRETDPTCRVLNLNEEKRKKIC